MTTLKWIIILLISYGISAQETVSLNQNTEEPNYLTLEDFTIENDRVSAVGKKISLVNSEKKYDEVTFSFTSSKQEFENISLKVLSQMVSETNNQTFSKINNQPSYIPKLVVCRFMEGLWYFHLNYVTMDDTKNSIGGFSIATFSEKGDFKKISIF